LNGQDALQVIPKPLALQSPALVGAKEAPSKMITADKKIFFIA